MEKISLEHLNIFYIEKVIEYHLDEKRRTVTDNILVQYIEEKLRRNEEEYL